MMNYLFRSTTRSFARTLGRILAYIAVGILIFILSHFINIASVDALSTAFAPDIGYSLINNGVYNYPLTVENLQYFIKFSNPNVQVNIQSPFFIEFPITNIPDYQTYDYVYLYGYSTISIDSAVGGACTAINASSSSFPKNSSNTSSLIPFAFKCTTAGSSVYFRFYGHIGNSDSINFSPVFYLANRVQLSTDAVAGSTEEAILKQTEIMKEQIEKVEKQQEEINNTLKDDKVDDAQNSANSFFDNFDDKDYGLSDIITMPLTFINKITSATCSPLKLPLPFVDTNAELPCVRSLFKQHYPQILTIYQTITFGIIAYWVCINIFRMVKNFKDPDNDEIEVLDL